MELRKIKLNKLISKVNPSILLKLHRYYLRGLLINNESSLHTQLVILISYLYILHSIYLYIYVFIYSFQSHTPSKSVYQFFAFSNGFFFRLFSLSFSFLPFLFFSSFPSCFYFLFEFCLQINTLIFLMA